jgi:hypothetical protein
MRYSIAGIGLFFLVNFSQAQDSTFSYHANVQAAFFSGQTPFWLHANQFGQIPTQGSSLAGQFGFYRNPGRSTVPKKRVDWSTGVELATYATGTGSNLFLTDAYLAVSLGALELSVGQKKEVVGLMDTTLTSGSLSLSGNSRPYPRLQIAFPHFLSLGFTKNFVAFKGSYSDGLMGEARVQYGNIGSIPALYMHHKDLYIRLGKPEHRLHLYGGFNHQAMWGGEDLIFTGGLERPLAYKYVVIGKPWANSRVGNHFGTIDMGAEWRGESWSYFAYRQNPYEDGSLAQLTNIADGLNGLRISRNGTLPPDGVQVKTLLIELLTTKSQGGDVFDFDNLTFGRDDYYNHYVYTQGWSYRGRALGTPIVPTQDLQRSEIPKDTSRFTVNNRLLALHLGMVGQIQDVGVQIRGTFSRHFGTYGNPFPTPRNQASLLLNAEKAIPALNGSFLSLKLAADLGTLYPNTFGLMLGWRKQGFL